MKIIEYQGVRDITIEFMDEYKTKIKTNWQHFSEGCVKNPYYKKVCGVGMVGVKYKPTDSNGKLTKEYNTWNNILKRSYDINVKKDHPTYKNVTCCNEWLLYENFYEWLHNQENFDKWISGNRWAIDKDILIKGNKIYSPDTCCLVPPSVNSLFTKCDSSRGNYPIGVVDGYGGKFLAISTHINNNVKEKYSKMFDTVEEAFSVYKEKKEKIIKQVAQEEYELGNITKKCYDAMMNYQVEITD